MTEVMTYILITYGYDVFSITSGKEVFINIKTNHPDLIIIDAMLPGINGNEICELIKLNKTTKNLPVIVFSEEGLPIDQLLSQKGAPDDILYKPLDITCLIEKVEVQLAA